MTRSQVHTAIKRLAFFVNEIESLPSRRGIFNSTYREICVHQQCITSNSGVVKGLPWEPKKCDSVSNFCNAGDNFIH